MLVAPEMESSEGGEALTVNGTVRFEGTSEGAEAATLGGPGKFFLISTFGRYYQPQPYMAIQLLSCKVYYTFSCQFSPLVTDSAPCSGKELMS